MLHIAVVFYYDYFITLDEEIQFFWHSKPNFIDISFFVNRYLSIFGTIPVFFEIFIQGSQKASYMTL